MLNNLTETLFLTEQIDPQKFKIVSISMLQSLFLLNTQKRLAASHLMNDSMQTFSYLKLPFVTTEIFTKKG